MAEGIQMMIQLALKEIPKRRKKKKIQHICAKGHEKSKPFYVAMRKIVLIIPHAVMKLNKH